MKSQTTYDTFLESVVNLDRFEIDKDDTYGFNGSTKGKVIK